MYQSVYFDRDPKSQTAWNYFLRDDKEGITNFKYFPSVYKLDEYGEHETLFGDSCSLVTGKYDKSDPDILEKDIDREIVVLRDLYYKTDDMPKYQNILDVDIEIEIIGPLNPTTIREANAEITSIALINFNTKEKICLILDKKKTLTETVRDGKRIIPCSSEIILLKKFLDIWEDVDPTIVTGWNCVDEDSNIWLENEIIKIKEVNEDSFLFKYGGINKKIKTGNKQGYKITLENGQKLISSKNHIFPYFYKDENQYKNKNTLLKSNNESSLEDIIKLKDKGNNIYLQQDKRVNNNEPLTYDKLINKLGKSNTKYTTENIISNNDLKLLGMIFTDGWYSNSINNDKYNVCVSNSNISIINNLIPLVNKYRNKSKILFNKLKENINALSTKPNYILKFSNYKNNFSYLKSLIYNKDNIKELNINLLSLLSYEKFKSFIEGMIDGDGSVNIQSTNISICNYEGQCGVIQELLQWNGLYSTQHNNIVSIPTSTINEFFISNLNLFHDVKNKLIKEISYFEIKNSIAKNIKKFTYEKFNLIKIKSIEEVGLCSMYDISTESHYFMANGIKTHNCDFFDIPYLYHRIKNLLGNQVYRLSPIGKIDENIYSPENPINIGLVNCLDYMLLMKKYMMKEEPSYKLGDIGSKYVKLNKIEYDGNLDKLFIEDINKFIDYNIRDVEIIEALEDKFKFIELTILICHLCHVPYQSIYYNTSLNEGAILTYLKRKGIISPNKPTTTNPSIKELNIGDHIVHQRGTPTIEGIITDIRGNQAVINTMGNSTSYRDIKTIKKKDSYAGGYLLDPKPGLYNWLSDFDYSSLYPSIIRSLNLSIETIIGRIISNNQNYNSWCSLVELKERPLEEIILLERLNKYTYTLETGECTVGKLIEIIEENKYTISANGTIFNSSKQGIVSEILSDWFSMRKQYKQLMSKSYKEGNIKDGELYHLKQHSFKILLNAMYGGFAINSWRYTDGYKICSSAITTTGQRFVQETIKYANEMIERDYL